MTHAQYAVTRLSYQGERFGQNSIERYALFVELFLQDFRLLTQFGLFHLFIGVSQVIDFDHSLFELFQNLFLRITKHSGECFLSYVISHAKSSLAFL